MKHTRNRKSIPPPGPVKDVPASQAPADKAAALIRGGTTSGSPGQLVRYWNRWRENYNALTALTIARVRALNEMTQRGDHAYPQWTYRTIERRHPVLSALITCCEAPIASFKWDVVVKKELPPGCTDAQAEAQRSALKAAYGQVDNLPAAIAHLAHADFSGYAHLQKHYGPAGQVEHLECLFPFCLCRDGLFGDWYWNPDSQAMTMPEFVLSPRNRIGGEDLPRADFVIREVARPINEIALENFVRRKLIEKDWSAFDEIFGIPSGVLIMPSGIPPEKVAEYEAAARMIAEGGTGAAPNGSEWKPNSPPADGSQLFKGHMEKLDEDLVLVGTGGKLKMLVEQGHAGSGGNVRGSSQTQADTFLQIAAARGGEVAACFQQDFDAVCLAEEFPGQPSLVEFRLITEDDTDIGALCTNIAALAPAGVKPNLAWLNEITGYQFEVSAVAAPLATGKPAETAKPEDLTAENAEAGKTAKVQNRSLTVPESTVQELAAALADDLEPLRHAIQAIEKISDPALFEKKLTAFIAEGGPLVKLLADINAYPKSAQVINDLSTGTMAGALTAKVQNRSGRPASGKILNGEGMGHPFRGNQYSQYSEGGGGNFDRQGAQRRGDASMDQAIKNKSDVENAMSHPATGPVDFRWGNARKGLQHIKDRRDAQLARFGTGPSGEEMLRKVPAVIAHGQHHMEGNDAVFEHAGDRVVLTKKWENKPSNHWVLNAYDISGGKGRR